MVKISWAYGIQQMIPNQPSSQRTNNHLPQGITNPDATQSRRIKLTSVHSLKKSPSARLLSPNQNVQIPTPILPYQQLYYQVGIYTQSYESVLEALQMVRGRTSQFQTIRDLQGKDVFSQKKRCLIMTSTNEKSMRLVDAINKKKNKNIDLILLGELKPNAQYLNDSVVLVTHDPKQVISFLRVNGFDDAQLIALQKRNSIQLQSMSSSGFRNTMLNLMRESEDSTNTPAIARRTHPSKQKPIHHWLVDKDSLGNFTTIEISTSPEINKIQKKSSQDAEESQVKQYDQRLVRQTNKDNSSNNKNEMPSKSKIEEKNKDTISKEIQGQQQVESPKKSTSNDVYQMNPRVYRHFPSNIITEVSDEYRGSVRESIMNIEPDLSFKSTRQYFPSNLINADQEEGSKRIISGLNTSEYRKVESIVNGVPTTYNPSSQVRYGSTYTPQTNKIYENVQYSNYQPPTTRIIKKEVSVPEEINSTTNLNPNITPTPIKQENISGPLISQQYVPGSYKAINSNRVSEVISSPTLSRQTYSSPIDQLRNISTPTYASTSTSQSRDPKVTYANTSNINWDDYEKIQSDGRTIYRRKVNNIPNPIVTQPTHLAKQVIQVKIVESETKQESIQNPKTEENQVKPQKVQENNQKNQKNIASQRKNVPSSTQQYANAPKELMLQSMLKPSMNTHSANPIPSVKVSAPLPLKQQSTRFTSLNTTKTPKKADKLDAKLKEPKSGPKPALLNQSNMFSRMSELHSDGSILRRNNIRFGVKIPQKQERVEPSMLESKLSGIYKGPADARKNTVNRAIRGQEELQQERGRLGHVITRFNCFHFIIQEELGYLCGTIEAHVATPNDRVETFTGMEQLYQRIRPDKIQGKFDAGFIFARKQEAQLINPALLPEDYYTVTIERGEGEAVLQVEQTGRRIRMDQLGRLLLAQRMVIDSKLYQYVAYRSHRREIELLADRFLHTQFILQQVETEFTSQILDFYYCQLPRLTRLYLLCDEQEIPQLVKLVSVYAELNPNFSPESCKLICLIGDILTNEALIMAYPAVTFISNPQDVRSHEDVLRYAHHAEEDQRRTLPTDRLFCHRGLQGLEAQLQERFPGRFLVIPFGKLSQVYNRLDKFGKVKNWGEKNYLVLHDSLSHQRVAVQKFSRVFMVGKVKVMQPHVARVLNYDELMEVLGK